VHEFSTDLVVRQRTVVADDIVALELGDPQEQDLPAWEPGAHVDLMLSDGLVRQYSLCGDPGQAGVWRIGVLRDPNSRGGSSYVHANLTEGTSVRVRGPRNHFPLVDSPRYQFIAGGIGITPIMAMANAVDRAGGDWSLLYLGRAQSTMAFADDLVARFGSRVTVWPADAKGGLFDLEAFLKEPQDDTLIYTCGPEVLMSAIEQHSAHWPAGSLHLERFAAKTMTAEMAAEALDEFEVVCQRSGITIQITADISILEAFEDNDVPFLGSCYEGVCGTCETKVLEGIPAHRDSILTPADQASNTVLMPCVSRSRTERLVLDI
jgi:ferredoxin-NADP reductase